MCPKKHGRRCSVQKFSNQNVWQQEREGEDGQNQYGVVKQAGQSREYPWGAGDMGRGCHGLALADGMTGNGPGPLLAIWGADGGQPEGSD